GHYYRPTIIAGPSQSSEIVQEEVFGPVVTVQRAKSDEQMV
ncbi:MAG: Aldehyde dehydrogenase family, partial [Chloroflexota bacterium]